MSTIVNIFENFIKFNDKNIFIIFDILGDIWFGMKDLLKTLGYTHKIKHIYDFNINKNNIKAFKNLKLPRSTEVPLNFQYNTKFINEYGLYELLSKSNKKNAKKFMKQYFTEIMPHIRKYGEYIMSQSDKNQIKLMNTKINNLKKENKELLLNQKNTIYPIGHAIYIIKQKKFNKIYYKLGYTKNLNKRLLTYNTSFPNKIKFNYYFMIKNKKTDKCIKKIMKNKEFIKNNEK